MPQVIRPKIMPGCPFTSRQRTLSCESDCVRLAALSRTHCSLKHTREWPGVSKYLVLVEVRRGNANRKGGGGCCTMICTQPTVPPPHSNRSSSRVPCPGRLHGPKPRIASRNQAWSKNPPSARSATAATVTVRSIILTCSTTGKSLFSGIFSSS